jgi:hypothetical protein
MTNKIETVLCAVDMATQGSGQYSMQRWLHEERDSVKFAFDTSVWMTGLNYLWTSKLFMLWSQFKSVSLKHIQNAHTHTHTQLLPATHLFCHLLKHPFLLQLFI